MSRPKAIRPYRFPKPYERCVCCGRARDRRRAACLCGGKAYAWGTNGDKDHLNSPLGQLVQEVLVAEGAAPEEAWNYLVATAEIKKLSERLSEDAGPGWQTTDFVLSGFGSWPLKTQASNGNDCFWG